MRKFLVGLAAILATGFSFPAHGVPAMTGPSTLTEAGAETLFSMQYSAWHYACELKQADCANISPPIVAYGLLPARFGQYSDGDGAIIIEVRLMAQPLSFMVMVHEMIHYLQYVQGEGYHGDDMAVYRAVGCRREAEAFDLTGELNRKLNYVVDDPRMKKGWADMVVLDDGTPPFPVYAGYGCPAPTATAAPPG